MSYQEAKRAHDEQMARVRAALDGNDPRAAAIAELRQQLATVTAERDGGELRLATGSKGSKTGVYMRLDAYQDLLAKISSLEEQVKALQARILQLEVDRSRAVKLRDETDNIIWSLAPDVIPGAINWGDLGVREVQEVINEERCWWRIVIEEADPVNPTLHTVVLTRLVALGWNADDIEIETAW